MGLFQKKTNPIADRTRALNAEIAELEAEIKRLTQRSEQLQTQPRIRSTALPGGTPAGKTGAQREPIFEQVDQQRVKSQEEAASNPAQFNELGVRKYDLAGAWRRFLSHLRGPPASNPKLINYLAAGSIQGLRPLRYEKRVARNRLIVLSVICFVLIWGILAYFSRHN